MRSFLQQRRGHKPREKRTLRTSQLSRSKERTISHTFKTDIVPHLEKKNSPDCGGFVNMTGRNLPRTKPLFDIGKWECGISPEFSSSTFQSGKSLRAAAGKNIGYLLPLCFCGGFCIFLLFRAFSRGIGRGRNIYFAKYFSLSLLWHC